MTTAKTLHRLVLTDRGVDHVHRFTPMCSCGNWVGVHRRRKIEAVKQYRAHREHVEARVAQLAMVPGAVTPPDRVPDALR